MGMTSATSTWLERRSSSRRAASSKASSTFCSRLWRACGSGYKMSVFTITAQTMSAVMKDISDTLKSIVSKIS